MTRADILRHLGGPSAISIWTVLLPLPLLIALRWLTLDLDDESLRWPYLLATVIGQALVGLGAWVAWRTVLPPTGRGPRPTTALAVFAALGALRIAGIAGTELALGLPLSRPVPQEFAVGAIQGVVVLGVIAVVVDSQREHRRTRARLLAIRERIRFIEGLDQARVREITALLLDDLARQVVERLHTIRLERADDPQSAARALRDIAEDYVRPLSHRIEDEWSVAVLPELVSRAAAVPSPTPIERVRIAVREATAALQPPPPVVATALMALVATPTLLRVYGLLATGFILATAVPILLAGTWATGAVMRRMEGRATMLALVLVLVLGVVTAATLSALADHAVYQAVSGEEAQFTATIATFTFIALGLSVIRTIYSLQARHQEELATGVAEEARVGDEIAQRLAGLRRSATRFLHSSVQGELVATAVMIERSRTEETDISRVISEVSDRVLQSVLVAQDAEADAPRSRLESQLAFWEAAADVSIAWDEQCWPWLDEHPWLADGVSRIVSEALTNAVRHGSGSITLRATVDGPALDLEVANSGTLPRDLAPVTTGSHGGSGLGLADVAHLTPQWSLSQEGSDVVLRARVET